MSGKPQKGSILNRWIEEDERQFKTEELSEEEKSEIEELIKQLYGEGKQKKEMALQDIKPIYEARDTLKHVADKLANKRGFATFDEWEEQKHPRGEGGQFVSKGSGSASGKSSFEARKEKRKKDLTRNMFLKPLTAQENEENNWLMSKERKDIVRQYNSGEKGIYNELNKKLNTAKEQREALKKEGDNGDRKKIAALTEKIRGYNGDLDDLALSVRERIKAGDNE